MSADARVALVVYVLIGGMLVVIALGSETWSRRPQYGTPQTGYYDGYGEYHLAHERVPACSRWTAVC